MRHLSLLLIAALLAGACSDSPGDTPLASDSTSTTSTSTSVPQPTTTPDATTSLPDQAPDCRLAASSTENEPSGAGSAGAATLRQLDHPLLARVDIQLDDGLFPLVSLVGPTGTRELAIPESPGSDVSLLLAGMRADTNYSVEIELLDADCAPVERLPELALITGSLPVDLPTMSATASDPERMAPGFTLFDLIDIRTDFGALVLADGELPPPAGWIFIVDNEGEVVWYHQEDHSIGDARMLPDGSILFEFNDTAARRIDLEGNVLDEWASSIITGRFALDAHGRQVVGDSPVVVDVDAMHHEQIVLPDGTHATLSTEIRVLDGFSEPQCGEDPATFDGSYHLIGDIAVVFDPESGDVLQEFNLFDYFDPRTDPAAFNLCGLALDFVFPNWLYRGVDSASRDWTHANAIEVDEANNALLISVRHLDSIIAVRWKDDASGEAGELLWHSGPLGDLELVSGDWHHHQHAPEVQADGTLLVYDNGNNRPGRGTPEAPFYSRAVIYEIDGAAGTIAQQWEYRINRDDEPLFAPFVGDADRLSNGNVLITNGGLNGSAGGQLSAQIVEVVPGPTSGGDVVFSFEVNGGAGWIVYRSERVPAPFG